MKLDIDTVQPILDAGFSSVMILDRDRPGLQLIADLKGDGSVVMYAFELEEMVRVFNQKDMRYFRLVEIDGNVIEHFDSAEIAARHVAKGHLTDEIYELEFDPFDGYQTWATAAVRLDLDSPSRN